MEPEVSFPVSEFSNIMPNVRGFGDFKTNLTVGGAPSQAELRFTLMLSSLVFSKSAETRHTLRRFSAGDKFRSE